MKDLLLLTFFYTLACILVLFEIAMACTIVLIPLLMALRTLDDMFEHPFKVMCGIWAEL